MRNLLSLSLLMAVLFSATVVADDTYYKPFIVASAGPGTLAEQTEATIESLEGADFEVVGQYSPVAGTNVVVVTNDQLKQISSVSDRGGYAAGQRVAITEAGDNIEVSFMNPIYIQYGYRLKGDMQPIHDALVESLGQTDACGAAGKKMTTKKLGKYHYMIGMQYFDDPSELGSFDSYETAIAAVEAGLAKEGDALTQVYRIDIPGKQQTVFGVGMKKTNEDNADLDSEFQMEVVDFEGCKKRAYFPYEVLVDGNKVEALHMRFRMALHFPKSEHDGQAWLYQVDLSPGCYRKRTREYGWR